MKITKKDAIDFLEAIVRLTGLAIALTIIFNPSYLHTDGAGIIALLWLIADCYLYAQKQESTK